MAIIVWSNPGLPGTSIFSRSRSGTGPRFFIFAGPVPDPVPEFEVPVPIFYIRPGPGPVPVPNVRGPLNSFFLDY